MLKKAIYLFIMLTVNVVLFSSTPILVYQFENTGSLTNPFKPTYGDGELTLINGVVFTYHAESYPGAEYQFALNTNRYPAEKSPSEIAGIQIMFSTENFRDISLIWHVKHTATSSNRVRVQYTLNGVDWKNFYANFTNSEAWQMTVNEQLATPIQNGYDNGMFTADKLKEWYSRKIDLSEIPEANDNKNFGIRFVTAHPTGKSVYCPLTGDYYVPVGSHYYGDFSFFGTTTVSNPVSNYKSGFYNSPIIVDLSSKTENAKIFYRLNTPETFEYHQPILIDKTTVLSFYAAKEGYEDSETVTETFTFYEEVNGISSLKEKKIDKDSIYLLKSEVIITMSDLGLIFAQDDSAGIVIQDLFSGDYRIGSKITDIMGYLTLVDEVIVLTPIYDKHKLISWNNQVVPIDVTINDLLQDNDFQYQARLVRVLNVNFKTNESIEWGKQYQIKDLISEFLIKPIFPTSDYLETMTPTNVENITGLAVNTFISPRFLSDFEDIVLSPLNLKATLNKNDVLLTWLPPDLVVRKLLGYNIYRDGNLLSKESISELIFIDKGLQNGEYFYHVTASFTDGESEPSNTEKVNIEVLNDVDEYNISNAEIKLIGNYPNPFNPETKLYFNISTGQGKSEGTKRVMITIYNLKGQKIRTLVNNDYSAGQHSVVWNGKDDYGKEVTTGIYLYQLTSDDFSETRKMIMIK